MRDRLVKIRRRQRPGPAAAAASGPFDEGRDLHDKAFYSACYAPTASMYFDQMGDVRACCQNTGGLLGNIREQSIREVWESAQADRLRRALASRDFSVGCGFCKWQVDEGGASPFARGFDRQTIESRQPKWPVQMEFSMTNSCNLQCVMCNGDWSSSIRAHREHRAPLPAVYRDEFFEELAEFLPHLRQAYFLGGEPFLGKEPLRVLDMLTELGSDTSISVTTNATQWSPRIERICSALPISFVVSLDGITKETYEAIRIGADFRQVMANIERFVEIAAEKGTEVSIAHCLMRPNWSEFIDLLLFAEDKGLSAVGINSVVFPKYLSLYQMPAEELADVVRSLERQDAGPARSLGRLRHVWDEQLEALRNRLAVLQSNDTRTLDPWSLGTEDEPTTTGPALLPEDPEAIAELEQWATDSELHRIRCSNDRVFIDGREINRPILEADEGFASLVGVHPASMVGQPMSHVFELLCKAFGEEHDLGPAPGGRANHVRVDFHTPDLPPSGAQCLLVDDGETIILYIAHRWSDEPGEP